MKDHSLAKPNKKSPDRFLFLRKFLKHGVRVASITPSSPRLAAAMCAGITPERPQTILELGAGDGAITSLALERMHPESRLLAIELDPTFADLVAKRCPRAEVIHGNAAQTSNYLDARRIDKIDLMICCLSTPTLPRQAVAAIFRSFEAYCPEDTIFSQLTVVPYLYLPFYRKFFEAVDFSLVLENLPPGGAYHCRRLRPGYQDRLGAIKVS